MGMKHKYNPKGVRCSCCCERWAEFSIAFKPGEKVFSIPLCHQCFDEHRIDAAFLGGCLENMQLQSEAA